VFDWFAEVRLHVKRGLAIAARPISPVDKALEGWLAVLHASTAKQSAPPPPPPPSSNPSQAASVAAWLLQQQQQLRARLRLHLSLRRRRSQVFGAL
jgi:hypothetical protein